MTKENFIQLVESLEKQTDYDKEMASHINKVFKCDALYDTSIVQDSVIKVLESELSDVDRWIDYFIYELDFGREGTTGSVMINKKPVPMRTPEDLWNILN